MLDLGIVIVNYNTRDLLRTCLETVYASEGDVSFEVCVVDNGSTDGSAAMVAEVFPQVRLVANPDNQGYPAANNQGLRAFGFPDAADAPRFALLLNPDTELPPSALREMVAFMDAHPDAGVVGPKLVRRDGSLDLACRRSFPSPEVAFYRLVGLSRLFPRSRRFGRYNLTYLDPDQMSEVDAVVGAFMMIRREAIRQVGLMDETFFMYGEDLDWCYRIKGAGWRVYYNPAVTVLHIKRASSRRNPRARVEFWRAMSIFYRKHYAHQTPLPVHLLIETALRLRTAWEAFRVRGEPGRRGR
ncbi:MAG TPA: glycosyltransferase family 2 protein [Anaerolineales bacterium]|nr:glycosyltransferase family 2 protein [Anaerolineae bacterium]HIP86804.1 glycosyltransferase family 2 protein [Anaerolineales bacterium]